MTAKELRKEFDLKLEYLQLNCPHRKTEILEYHPMPGHFMGYVKSCVVCEKILEQK